MTTPVILRTATLLITLLVAEFQLTTCELQQANKSMRTRVLRGQKKNKPEGPVPPVPQLKERKAARNKPVKKAARAKTSPDDKEPKTRQFARYTYFVEACQEELTADVINGGIIQHNQYVNFIYGYCRASDDKGGQCNRDNENKGFAGLKNDMKLMYIKSFCPEDVDGQVACLHGMNERGREYEFNDELDRLCRELEKLMFKNQLLQVKKVPHEEQDFFSQPQIGGLVNNPGPVDTDHHAGQDTISGYEAIGAYQSGYKPPGAGGSDNDLTVSFVGQTDSSTTTPAPVVPPATRRPTPNPTARPTLATKHGGGKEPAAYSKTSQPPIQPPPWERPSANGGTNNNGMGILAEDADAHMPGRGTVAPRPTPRPTSRLPDLRVVDANGNPIRSDKEDNDNTEEGMSAGGIVAIVLIVLLGMVIAFTTLLIFRKWKRLQDAQAYNQHNNPLGSFFFMNMRKVKPTDGTQTETETHDKTYEEEHNESIGSEEIDFHGPLFDSWPAVTPRHQDFGGDRDDHLVDTCCGSQPQHAHQKVSVQAIDVDTLKVDPDVTTAAASKCNVENDEGSRAAQSIKEEQATDTDQGPRTFTSSLLSSFFSRAKRGGPEVTPSADNAIDEIKRAINDAQWQEVYYLASKMAAEGNIDSNENLQSALVRSNEQRKGNFGGPDQAHARSHLKPEDAARAEQLDLSLVVGDWITLAARAAVFAALDSANNPVPTSISFVNGSKSNANECLDRAKTALEEAERAQARKREQQQEDSADSVISGKEEVQFVDADDDIDYEYPKDDYSDFSKTSHSSVYTSKRLPGPPSLPKHLNSPEQTQFQSHPTCVEEADSESDSSDNDETESQSCATRTSIPGPPSIAMSNQSTIPTRASSAGTPIPFATIEESARGPFRRDFEHDGVSQMMEQDEETELTPNISV